MFPPSSTSYPSLDYLNPPITTLGPYRLLSAAAKTSLSPNSLHFLYCSIFSFFLLSCCFLPSQSAIPPLPLRLTSRLLRVAVKVRLAPWISCRFMTLPSRRNHCDQGQTKTAERRSATNCRGPRPPSSRQVPELLMKLWVSWRILPTTTFRFCASPHSTGNGITDTDYWTLC